MSRCALNSGLGAADRPMPSKHVQPLCSQFCSQLDGHLSAGRRLSRESVFFERTTHTTPDQKRRTLFAQVALSRNP